MNPLDAGFECIEFYFLIFARLVGVFVQAPLFGRPKGVPAPVQVGYSLAISLVMYSILPIPKHLPENAVEYGFAIAGQVSIGLMLGFASYMVAAGLQFAGEIIDVQMGLSIAANFDPSAGGTVNMIRQFQFRLALLVWIFIHGDYFFFKAIRRSYELIPPDTSALTQGAVFKLVDMTSGLFVMGLELSAPVVAALFITNVALGLLNRAAQQFNVFMISFPLSILIGMGVMILGLGTLMSRAIPNLYSHLNHDMMELIMALKAK